MKLLLVEDNKDLALNIVEYLESNGHVIDYAADGLTGLDLAGGDDFDVIILDVMMPGIDGFAFCFKLRQELEKAIPVIFLTARDTEQDILMGFSAGGDDYLVKPFYLPELEARVKAISRRGKNTKLDLKVLQVADLQLDLSTLDLKRGGVKLSLPPVPRKILMLLMRNSHRVVTRQEIEQEIWRDDPPDSEVLRAHIYAIRRAIDIKGMPKMLHTIHGVGYRLVNEE